MEREKTTGSLICKRCDKRFADLESAQAHYPRLCFARLDRSGFELTEGGWKFDPDLAHAQWADKRRQEAEQARTIERRCAADVAKMGRRAKAWAQE